MYGIQHLKDLYHTWVFIYFVFLVVILDMLAGSSTKNGKRWKNITQK